MSVERSEANKRKSSAVERAMHSKRSPRAANFATIRDLRMPSKYSAEDVEVILEALWGMFTQSQANKLVVAVPWDESEDSPKVRLADFVSLLESWLD